MVSPSVAAFALTFFESSGETSTTILFCFSDMLTNVHFVFCIFATMLEKINILIRTHNRPELFKRCLDSCLSQHGAYIKIIVAYDTPCNYIPNWCYKIKVISGPEPYFYDCYLNQLKDRVTSGYFMFLDDDDYLLPGVLSQVQFTGPVIIHKLNHIGNIIPKRQAIELGQIGMPCFMIHHSLKNTVNFTGQDHGDYWFAKELEKHAVFQYSDLVLVECDRKGWGK